MGRNTHPAGLDEADSDGTLSGEIDDLLQARPGLALLDQNFADCSSILPQCLAYRIDPPYQVIGGVARHGLIIVIRFFLFSSYLHHAPHRIS